MQTNVVITDTMGAIENVRIKRVELFRENAGAFFPQGQSKLFAVIMGCSYLNGVWL